MDLADLMSRARIEQDPEKRERMVTELIEWRARQEMKKIKDEETDAVIVKKLKPDDKVGESETVTDMPPHLQSPAQRAMEGEFGEDPYQEYDQDQLQRHMNLLVRGATVDMEDIDSCQSAVKKVEQITHDMEEDTYECDSDYNSEEEGDPKVVEMYDMACSAVGWTTPPTYKVPTSTEMQRGQKDDQYTSHIRQALTQYQNSETISKSDEEWARDNEANYVIQDGLLKKAWTKGKGKTAVTVWQTIVPSNMKA